MFQNVPPICFLDSGLDCCSSPMLVWLSCNLGSACYLVPNNYVLPSLVYILVNFVLLAIHISVGCMSFPYFFQCKELAKGSLYANVKWEKSYKKLVAFLPHLGFFKSSSPNKKKGLCCLPQAQHHATTTMSRGPNKDTTDA